MTRQDILNDYAVNDHGIIQSPGKFEGCMLYAPYFWAMSADGSADTLYWSDDTVTFIMEIDADDRAIFPELEPRDLYLHLQESETGFVACELLTQGEYDALIAQNEQDNAENESECE